MAWLCAALVLSITTLSAYLRLTQAGLGCADWPACYGQRLREDPRIAVDFAPATAVARFAHRIAASTTGALVIMMTILCLATRPVLWREGRIALALLACAIFLAVLGRWTAGARVPAVAIGNVLAGFAMLALAWRLARSTGAPPADASTGRAYGGAAVAVLVVLQIALGVQVSASLSGLGCPDLLHCDLAATSLRDLDPWREPVLASSAAVVPASLANVLHRGVTVIVLVAVLAWAAAAWRRGQRTAAALLGALLVAQIALGVILVVGRLPLAAAIGHNVIAGLLLAAAVDPTGKAAARARR